jgi:hypothetical protein
MRTRAPAIFLKLRQLRKWSRSSICRVFETRPMGAVRDSDEDPYTSVFWACCRQRSRLPSQLLPHGRINRNCRVISCSPSGSGLQRHVIAKCSLSPTRATRQSLAKQPSTASSRRPAGLVRGSPFLAAEVDSRNCTQVYSSRPARTPSDRAVEPARLSDFALSCHTPIDSAS